MPKRVGRPEKGFAEQQKKKIIEILSSVYPVDMTEVEIAGKLGVIRHTSHKYLKELLKDGKIRINRKLGKYTFYVIKK